MTSNIDDIVAQGHRKVVQELAAHGFRTTPNMEDVARAVTAGIRHMAGGDKASAPLTEADVVRIVESHRAPGLTEADVRRIVASMAPLGAASQAFPTPGPQPSGFQAPGPPNYVPPRQG